MSEQLFYNEDCRYFSGYKPCKFKRECKDCPKFERPAKRVCIISLEALGAVLRSTVLLKPILRKYPNSHITWITLPSAKPLLENNPMIDRLICLDGKNDFVVRHLEFDVLMCVDKSIEAGAVAEEITAKEKFGFGMSRYGTIRPLTEHAYYQFQVGLDDHLKFKVNQKAETQQITETMNLEWQRDDYELHLSDQEKETVKSRRAGILANGSKGIIGYNTGCSLLYPYKKFTVERGIEVIAGWRKQFPEMTVALFGGREDAERQDQMKKAFASDPYVVNTPTNEGLRSGMLWMATSDMVLSGCSLGMHVAIGLKKPVIAWFGVSCLQEVDLYDRGVRIQSDVTCSPCWRKSCDNTPKCYDQVAPSLIVSETAKILKRIM